MEKIKCGACKAEVEHGVNGNVYQPLSIVMAWCYPCLDKYDGYDYDMERIDDMQDQMDNGATFLEA